MKFLFTAIECDKNKDRRFFNIMHRVECSSTARRSNIDFGTLFYIFVLLHGHGDLKNNEAHFWSDGYIQCIITGFFP